MQVLHLALKFATTYKQPQVKYPSLVLLTEEAADAARKKAVGCSGKAATADHDHDGSDDEGGHDGDTERGSNCGRLAG